MSLDWLHYVLFALVLFLGWALVTYPGWRRAQGDLAPCEACGHVRRQL